MKFQSLNEKTHSIVKYLTYLKRTMASSKSAENESFHRWSCFVFIESESGVFSCALLLTTLPQYWFGSMSISIFALSLFLSLINTDSPTVGSLSDY